MDPYQSIAERVPDVDSVTAADFNVLNKNVQAVIGADAEPTDTLNSVEARVTSLEAGGQSTTASNVTTSQTGFSVQDHIDDNSNPHSVTKTQIGLSNVPNTDATNPANIAQTSSYRFVTDTEKNTWNGKLDASRGNWKIFYSDGSGVFTELGLGSAGKVLQSNGASSVPTWETASAGLGDKKTITSSSYQILTTDGVIFSNYTSGEQILSLPDPSAYSGVLYIKKLSTAGNTTTIQVLNTSEFIDGILSEVQIVTQYQSYTFVSDGTDWFIV